MSLDLFHRVKVRCPFRGLRLRLLHFSSLHHLQHQREGNCRNPAELRMEEDSESEGARRSPEIEDTVCGGMEITTSHALTEGLTLETAQRGTEVAKKSDAAMAEGESEDKARVGLFRMLSQELRSTTRRGRGRVGEVVKEMPNCSVAISQHDGEHSELEPLQLLQSVRGTMLSNTIQDSKRISRDYIVGRRQCVDTWRDN